MHSSHVLIGFLLSCAFALPCDRLSAEAPRTMLSGVQAIEPYQLGGERHLFIDEMAIAKMKGARLVANPPLVHQVVIPPTVEMSSYSSVVDDGSGTYKLYYLVQGSSNLDDFHWFIALATSKDGIHWELPKLGLIEHKGSKDNNYVIHKAAMGSVYYDPYDPRPEYRYKYLSHYQIDNKPDTPTKEGVVLYTSPDGFHFTKNEVELFPSYSSESQAVLLYDPYIRKYVAFLRGYIQGDGERRRSVLRAETDDPLKPWPMANVEKPYFMDPEQEMPYLDRELEMVFSADMDDPPNSDMYNSQVFLYPWANRVYLAFPTWYYHYSKDRSYLRQLQLDGREDITNDFNVGTGEVQLMVSRDGHKWTRYRETPYIKHGWWGDHYAYWTWLFQGMIRQGNKILQYGILRDSGHGSIEFMRGSSQRLKGLVCFEQQADRFAGIEFDYTGGRVITEPLAFKGNRLVLNVDTGAMGEARVGIIRADGTRLPGFDVEDCDIINGDWFDKTVSWKRGNKNIARLADQPVRLVFDMRHARLFAMQFLQRDEEDDPSVQPKMDGVRDQNATPPPHATR